MHAHRAAPNGPWKREHRTAGPVLSIGQRLPGTARRERLSPILMTSLATGLALVPLVVLGGRVGHETEYPPAVVVLGGLVSSVLLSLFVVPSLHLRLGSRRAADPSAG